MKQFKLQCIIEPLQIAQKEKCKTVAIDYYELYIAMIDLGNKLHLYSFNTLNRLHLIELKTIDECQICFGQKSKLIGVYSNKEFFVYICEGMELKRQVSMNNILKLELSHHSLDEYFLLTQKSLATRNIQIFFEECEPITIIGVMNQPRFNLILFTTTYIELLMNMKRVIKENVQISTEQTLSSSNKVQLDLNKRIKVRYDEQTATIAIIDGNLLTFIQIVDTKLKVKYLKVQQRVEKIFDGCFFQLPFYKQANYFGDQLFVYCNYYPQIKLVSMSKGKLGSMICSFDMDGETFYEQVQMSKCKYLRPVFRWGNQLFAHFESGTLSRVLLYKNIQFEKLEHQFTYLPHNEVYQELQNEFVKKEKNNQEPLNKSLFQTKNYDPFYLYNQ